MSKKPYEDLIEQKIIQEKKNTKQHWPCHGGIIKTRNTEDAREIDNRIIREKFKAIEEIMLKTMLANCRENDRGVPFMQKRQKRDSSADRMLTNMVLETGKTIMARIRQGR